MSYFSFSIRIMATIEVYAYLSIGAEYLRAMSVLFSPNLIDQSPCRILTTHAKTRPVLHDD